ncbi:hypothetical protein IY145_15115 [Methylosinus sp. H3A]|uniref:hypothetical protein n=1 Tax=Methylosinus sp. H3A TaxID=2785786 RepID=UPI0018C29308|nr:hypothetical protein [Methylosinus sp. H3A]MBG0810701.1 hypothetical protein [Methylosinus sp. H3A]
MFFTRKRQREFSGYVDRASGGRVSGWVYDRLRPRDRFEVEICSAGAVVGIARADEPREDLARAGFGDGRYGFHFDLPNGDYHEETLAARVRGEAFWLLDSSSRQNLSGELINSTRRGLPRLEPTLSLRRVDERDAEIAAELQSAWAKHASRPGARQLGGGGAMWTDIVSKRHQPLLALLDGGDPRALAQCLVDAQKSSVATGLEQGVQAYHDFLAASPEGRRVAVAPFHDMLASLAQYLGLARVECSEQDYVGETLVASSRRLVAEIEAALGFAVTPPAVFDGLYGLSIGEGVLHGRDIQALYLALRAIEASGVARPKICEIGGGFGKAARYALLAGARHYTIVDLPTVAALQFFSLRRALPEAQVRFRHPREPSQGEGVDLVLASDIDDATVIASDILVNCDSFPEMGDAVCRSYFARIGRWAPLLLSVNQEANREVGSSGRQSVVGALLPDYGFTRRYRFRSWIRRGYAEELWSAPERPAEL